MNRTRTSSLDAFGLRDQRNCIYPTMEAGDGSTLSLDFTMGSLDPRFTFTRSSTTATFVNGSGLIATAGTNVPRFDYSPTTLSPRGLLIEGSATNELQRSNQFNTSPWYMANFITPTIASPAVTDPAGGTNTWYGVPSGSGLHGFRYNVTFTGSSTYTFSIWAKAAQHDKFIISDGSSGQGACRFDLTNVTANTITGVVAPTNAQIVPYPNGWFRCSFTMVMPAATPPATTIVKGMTYSSYPTTGATISAFGATFTATGTDGMYFYGAQIENAPGPSSYIPTVASTVQRAADDLQLDGANFSSIWPSGLSEWSVYWSGDITRAPTTTQLVWLARAGGSSRTRGLVTNTSSIRSSNNIADLTPGLNATVNTVFKMATGFKDADCFMWAHNGTTTASASDTSSGLQTDSDRLLFNVNVENFMHIRQFKFWQSRLSNGTLQGLVS